MKHGIDPALLSLAEDANTHTPLRPREERIACERFVIFLAEMQHPAATVVQHLRLASEGVEDAVEEIRGLLRERGRLPCTLEVGSHATPPDLPDRLLALGLEPFQEPLAVGMALLRPPSGTSRGIEVRRAATPTECAAAERIARECFGMAPEPEDLERAARQLEEQPAADSWATYLAFADGEPIAQAQATFTPRGAVMNGGSTLPRARGRGAYRALVLARWRDAVARGTPTLVTQAGAMSRPILERLGFHDVCRIHILLDDPDGG